MHKQMFEVEAFLVSTEEKTKCGNPVVILVQ